MDVLSYFNGLQAWRLRLQNRLGKFAWVVKNWALSLALLVFGVTFLTLYLPDAFTSQTRNGVEIIETSQNTGTYTAKLKLPDNTVISVRIVEQKSDLLFNPVALFNQASTIVDNNLTKAKDEKQLVTVRLSGFGFGDASKAQNLTQINPPLPSFLYNLLGWLVVVAYVLVPLIALPKLAVAFIKRRSYLTGGAAVAIVLFYVWKWFY